MDDDGEGGRHQGVQHIYEGGRGDVISGVARRRRWSGQEKAQILRESFAPGANVSDVARRFNVSIGLVHNWRRAVRGKIEAAEGPSFVRVLPLTDGPTASSASVGELIEIDIGGACVRIRGPVDRGALKTVIDLLRSP